MIAALEPENIPLTLVQKWLRQMRDYMTAHEAGASGATADKAAQQYKSRGPSSSASTRRRPAGLSYRRSLG
jgi:hypothetical protein